jgi:hypothetical protein
VLLNEIAFQNERFELAVHNDPLDVSDFGNEPRYSIAVVRPRLEVGANTRAQAKGLPNIEDLALVVFIYVTARRGG